MNKKFEIKCYPGNHPRIDVTEEFIAKQRFSISKTPEEMLQKIEESREKMFDFSSEVLIPYLPWEKAKTFYKEEYVKEVDSGAKTYEQITDVNEATQDMLDYLIFGYMKALDERGISASRTVNKLAVWFWLLGREDLAEVVSDDSLYNPYGMPALIKVTELMELPVPDDIREFANNKC